MNRSITDSKSSSQAKRDTSSGTARDPAELTPDTHPPMSVEQVATTLGVHRSEIMELVCTGKLPAKRIGAGTFVTAASLAVFLADADPASSFPRFERGDLVVWMDESGDHGIGRFVAENGDGTVRVLRNGFWGEYETTFPAMQVQPFTCRVPPSRAY